ncbi:MAG: LysR family transcriptional regulator [Roseobacter sp.]
MKLKSLRSIEYFLAAHRAGSFHAAARDVGMTQTAITKSIRELENTFGAALLERSVKGVVLTVFGEQFRRRAIQIEQQSGFLERELAEMIAGQAGRLRIGAGTVWSDVFLPDLLSTFCHSRPNVEIVIRRGVGQRFRTLLEEGEIDIGLGLEPSPDDLSPELILEPLARINTQFIVRHDHPLTRRSKLTLADIASYPWAMYRLDTPIFDRVRRMFMEDGLTLQTPALLSDSSVSVMQFVGKADHITCFPVPMLETAKQLGLTGLRMVDCPLFQSGAVYMKAANDYPLMQDMMKVLKAYRFRIEGA